ncbi:DJ-1/PfpI family protein, partial [Hominenteromicrobium sp.]|uniref:DJ-1/PfpI family protein n=1 Tax=Hominenteromicrobium sp. TaxID=3073581 RepID=UPI003990EE56
RAELEVKIVGVGGKTITGSHGITVTADIEEKDVTTDDMELMILPGGMPGTLNLEKSPIVTTCAEYCAKNDIYLAAICAAPSVLGHLGLLNGKEAICFPGFEGELKGATISEKPVCVDGKIVTAKGMGVAVQFGLTLAGLMVGKDVERRSTTAFSARIDDRYNRKKRTAPKNVCGTQSLHGSCYTG